MFCEKCGTKNEDGMSFCSACGTPLAGQQSQNTEQQSYQAQPQAQVAQAPVCTNCGATVPAGGRFCEKCGTPVAIQQQAVQQPQNTQPQQQSQAPTQQQSYQAQPQQQSQAPTQQQSALCSNCGASLPQGGRFCEKCGTPVAVQQNYQASAAQGLVCSKCGAAILQNASFCEICGTPVNVAATDAKPKKSKGKKIAIITIIVALVALLGFGGYHIYKNFFAASPVQKITQALSNSLEKIDNADFEITVSSPDGDGTINGEFELDIDNEYFAVHAVVDAPEGNEDGEMWIRYQDAKLEAYTMQNGKKKEVRSSDLKSAQNMIPAIFDAVQEAKGILSSDTLDFSGLPEDMREDMKEYCNIDNEKAVKKFLQGICKVSTLEEIANYEKSKSGDETVYTFTPDLKEIVNYLKKDKSGFLTDEAIEELKEIDTSELPSIDESPTISFYVKDEMLVGMDVTYQDSTVTLHLNNINNTSVDF